MTTSIDSHPHTIWMRPVVLQEVVCTPDASQVGSGIVDHESVALMKAARRTLLALRRSVDQFAMSPGAPGDGAGECVRRVSSEASLLLSRLLSYQSYGDGDAERDPGGEQPGIAPRQPNPMDLVWGSHREFYAEIAALLDVLKTEWLSKYQDSLGNFLEFYKEFSDIMEQIKPSASDDKGNVTINFKDAIKALDELVAKYGVTGTPLASFATKAEADRFMASIGLPGMKVGSIPGIGGGRWGVFMDISPVTDLSASMSVLGTGEVTLDSARYNAWVSSKDSNLEQIKHMSKVFGEKLSEMTQKFDNVVKILSSTIEKISQADDTFVRF